LTTLIVGLLVFAGSGLAAGRPNDPGTGLIVGALAIALLLPALLLVAALVTLIVLAVSSRPDKGREYRQLGRITAGAVLGTVLGIVPMACLLVVFRR
jgi:hypothetical protein